MENKPHCGRRVISDCRSVLNGAAATLGDMEARQKIYPILPATPTFAVDDIRRQLALGSEEGVRALAVAYDVRSGIYRTMTTRRAC